MLDALANFNVTEVPSLKTSVREAMSTLNTTTVNLALGLPGMFSTFNAGQLYRIRVVAITASALSIFGGVVGIYCMLNIDKRRKVFRHDDSVSDHLRFHKGFNSDDIPRDYSKQ